MAVETAPAVTFLASDAPEALAARERLVGLYGDAGSERAEVLVALGGDGMMLRAQHRFMGRGLPIFGMNRGSVAFLMNEFREDGLMERLARAERTVVHPLVMLATDVAGTAREARAINEVSLLRQTHQAARLRIEVDGTSRLAELVADGAMVATPAGSTAYNLSANGPILPLTAPLMALTPISAFRPRRWRGALLPDRARVVIEVLEPERRPVAATADHAELRDVARVEVMLDRAIDLVLLHDPGHGLDERILREQFDV